MLKTSMQWLALCMTLLLAGCASAPWEGMSENDISGWKSAGFDAESSQTWMNKEFNSMEAKGWNEQGFNVDDAVEWKDKDFTSEQAGQWRAADFDLGDAIDHRAEGLAPIKP